MTADQYREEHGLRLRHPLTAEDLRAGHSERVRARMESDPDAWEKDFRHSPATLAEFAAGGRESIAATSERPGHRAARRAGWSKFLASRNARLREKMEARARDLGYRDLGTYLTARSEATSRAIGAELGVTHNAAQAWRRRILGGVPDVAAAQAAVAARQRRLDDKARAAGSRDLAHLIEDTAGHPLKPLARRTGIAVNTIKKYRTERLS